MTTNRYTALLAGATGLVGGECLRQLVASDRYAKIIVVTRRDLGAAARSPKVHQVVTELLALGDVRRQLQADHVFSALGTTMKKAGSRARFREVDFEYPLRLAQLALKNGATHYSLVSAIGADARSPFFYSRVKGQVEAALRGMGWPSLAIVRPSIIAGQRGEFRPLEKLGERLMQFAPSQWKPVQAADIAAAMVVTAARSPAGVTIIESREIPAIARGVSA
jgi:uncharacterized protein YbjT (DUF2867 family)